MSEDNSPTRSMEDRLFRLEQRMQMAEDAYDESGVLAPQVDDLLRRVIDIEARPVGWPTEPEPGIIQATAKFNLLWERGEYLSAMLTQTKARIDAIEAKTGHLYTSVNGLLDIAKIHKEHVMAVSRRLDNQNDRLAALEAGPLPVSWRGYLGMGVIIGVCYGIASAILHHVWP
jgi:hypothetical protein